jgi:hypothetical protein
MERRRNGFTHKQKREVRERQNGVCACCGQTPHQTLEVHHIKPYSKGGPNDIENAVAACKPCHKLLDDLVFQRGIQYSEDMQPGQEYLVALFNTPPFDASSQAKPESMAAD